MCVNRQIGHRPITKLPRRSGNLSTNWAKGPSPNCLGGLNQSLTPNYHAASSQGIQTNVCTQCTGVPSPPVCTLMTVDSPIIIGGDQRMLVDCLVPGSGPIDRSPNFAHASIPEPAGLATEHAAPTDYEQVNKFIQDCKLSSRCQLRAPDARLSRILAKDFLHHLSPSQGLSGGCLDSCGCTTPYLTTVDALLRSVSGRCLDSCGCTTPLLDYCGCTTQVYLVDVWIAVDVLPPTGLLWMHYSDEELARDDH